MLKTKGNPLKVHSKVHFLNMRKFSIGFYTGGGNIKEWNHLSKEERNKKLSKDWYVWWSYRNPETKRLERQEPNIKEGINCQHNKKDRLKAMKDIKSQLTRLLKGGYSPYTETNAHPEQITIEFAFEKALSIKKKEVQETTYKDYNSRITYFQNYLHQKNYKNIREVDKKITSSFLNTFKGKTANNYKAAISSIFTILSDEDLIEFNFIKELRNKNIRKKAKKAFTEQEINLAYRLMEDQDPFLLVYIYLISYMFWRPIEIVRIEIKDIDFRKKLMKVDTKSKDSKTKIIPEIIEKDLIHFAGKRKGRLFDLKAKSNIDKRTYMTGRFRRFRKKNGLSDDLTPYSFRHYSITKAYNKLRENLNVADTIKELSLITGHDSKAIWNYIQTNDIELPKEYSDLLK